MFLCRCQTSSSILSENINSILNHLSKESIFTSINISLKPWTFLTSKLTKIMPYKLSLQVTYKLLHVNRYINYQGICRHRNTAPREERSRPIKRRCVCVLFMRISRECPNDQNLWINNKLYWKLASEKSCWSYIEDHGDNTSFDVKVASAANPKISSGRQCSNGAFYQFRRSMKAPLSEEAKYVPGSNCSKIWNILAKV